MATATIIIDPGHGGTGSVGGSDGNHAVSVSGVKEKDLTLLFAKLVKSALQSAAASGGHTLQVILTRTVDENLSLDTRARFAQTNHADRFLSIHFNAFNGVTRGVETYIRRHQDNVNLEEDRRFARRIQNAVFDVIEGYDPASKDRGVKEEKFGVLNDSSLGNTTGGKCRACLLEVEFLDVSAVDVLLNTGSNAAVVRQGIAQAIANAIIKDVVNP